MLERKVEQIEAKLLDAVNNADDHALFIASYLHGHFDIVVSQTEQLANANVEHLDEFMQQSLQTAFDNHELAADEQRQVFTLWQSLISAPN
ncbi:YfcL family protein [Alteromonas flava]|uniref:YfcL family protein n=1 Tax=Alteromonas flava TaxID=2048003 RepID=UPI0013DA8C11|nr:YfcL family protein [Alteromonas flava]